MNLKKGFFRLTLVLSIVASVVGGILAFNGIDPLGIKKLLKTPYISIELFVAGIGFAAAWCLHFILVGITRVIKFIVAGFAESK